MTDTETRALGWAHIRLNEAIEALSQATAELRGAGRHADEQYVREVNRKVQETKAGLPKVERPH